MTRKGSQVRVLHGAPLLSRATSSVSHIGSSRRSDSVEWRPSRPQEEALPRLSDGLYHWGSVEHPQFRRLGYPSTDCRRRFEGNAKAMQNVVAVEQYLVCAPGSPIIREEQ